MVTKMHQPDFEFLPDGSGEGMRVAILEQPFSFVIKMARIPEPSEEEVLVKISYVGICGSDVEAYRGTRSPEFVTLPARLGHEVAGAVVKVGERVNGVQVGDQVSLRYVWGAFAEYICCKPFNIMVISANIPLLETSLIEILPSVLHAVELGEINPSKRVLIIGQGVSGLVLTQVVSLFSPHALAVTDLFESKLALSRKYGATHTYCIPDPHSRTMDIVGRDFPEGFDVVIPCLLEGDGMVDAIDSARQNGKVVMYGCIGVCNKPIDFFRVHRKRIDILSTEPKRDIDMRRYFEEGVRLVGAGLINTSEMITHIMGLSEIQDAFVLREKHRKDVIHVMIDCQK